MAERRQMIEPAHPKLSTARQCRLLGLPRSSYCRRPKPKPVEDLALMRVIDEVYLAQPVFGSRQMTRWLRRQGYEINRKRVRRLMRLMGLEALYPKPNLSRPQPGQPVYPCYDAERVEQKKSELVARGNGVRFGRKKTVGALSGRGVPRHDAPAANQRSNLLSKRRGEPSGKMTYAERVAETNGPIYRTGLQAPRDGTDTCRPRHPSPM